MNATVKRFCGDLLDEHRQGRRHHPETIAARFVECFGVSLRPTLEEIKALLRDAGFGEVVEMSLDEGMKGLHVGIAGEECHIYYKEELWQGARDYTVLHESYEIMHETLCELDTGTKPVREVCREADRFAAAVLMQPGEFRSRAQASGLDVIALQREYRYAYAAVALRLAEVVRSLPYFVVLYERPGRSDPANWPRGDDLAALRATVVQRKNGMGPPTTQPITGKRGGIPQRYRRVPSGSLAERAARSGGQAVSLGVLWLAAAGRPLEGPAGQAGGGRRPLGIPQRTGAAAVRGPMALSQGLPREGARIPRRIMDDVPIRPGH